jgi:hypothetical protein
VASLKLADFLDEEFLALVQDLADYEGWVSSQVIANSIPIEVRNVSSRLSWMKRFGVVERDTRPGSRTRYDWRLTEVGEALVKARFSKSQQTALAKITDDQLWALTQDLSSRYEGVGNAAANLIRRRFTASTVRRKYL